MHAWAASPQHWGQAQICHRQTWCHVPKTQYVEMLCLRPEWLPEDGRWQSEGTKRGNPVPLKARKAGLGSVALEEKGFAVCSVTETPEGLWCG